MGPFVKRAALSGLLVVSSSAACQAQTGWNWPATTPKGTVPSKQISWSELPQAAQNAGLFGGSDLQSTSSSAPTAAEQVRSAGAPTPLPWPAVPASARTDSVPSGDARAQGQPFSWDKADPSPGGPAVNQASSRIRPTERRADNAASADARLPAPGIIGPIDHANNYAGPGLIGPIDQAARLSSRLPGPPVSNSPIAPSPEATSRSQAQTSQQTPAANGLSQVSTRPTASNQQPVPHPQYELQSLTKAFSTDESLGIVSDQAKAVAKSSASVNSTTYTLRDLSPDDGLKASGDAAPIAIIPFSRLTSQTTELAIGDGTFSTQEMTGPLTNPAILFSKLHIDNDFRDQPAALPSNVRIDADATGYGPEWMYQNYVWVSPAFYHQPLYFEQTNLERYGIGPRRGLQPLASQAHFFGCITLLPYKMLAQPPCEQVYTLGNQRPGDCVRFQKRTLLGQSTIR